MEAVSRQGNRENLEQAFEIAESLGVTRLLDAEGEAVNLTGRAGGLSALQELLSESLCLICLFFSLTVTLERALTCAAVVNAAEHSCWWF